MATYAIGDIHGCYDQLQSLLQKINFEPEKDQLLFTGDLVNGGPKPAETLRLIKSLSDRAVTVLGNHDLVLLSVAHGHMQLPNDRKYSMQPVLDASDSQELIEWLQQLPLVYYDSMFNVLLVHAGILPQWTVSESLNFSKEVTEVLQSSEASNYFANMMGNEPIKLEDAKNKWERLRFITNCFTRMRFCNFSGELELSSKGKMSECPTGYDAWFNFADRLAKDTTILFGHWAALNGHTGVENVVALDTGCVWGGTLTAMCLDDRSFISVPS